MSEGNNLWALRTVALVIAIITWLFASFLPRLERLGESAIERELEVPLSYAAPPSGLVADPNRRTTVLVRIKGSPERIRQLSSDSINVTVPLPRDFTPGTATEVELQEQDAVTPDGVEIVSFTPTTIPVTIDIQTEIQIRVLPEFRGEPAAGLTRDNIRWNVEPEFVTVRGPRGQLSNLTQVATEPISVTGRAIDFREQVGIQLGNPALTARPNLVTVEVFLEPASRRSSANDPPASAGSGSPNVRPPEPLR